MRACVHACVLQATGWARPFGVALTSDRPEGCMSRRYPASLPVFSLVTSSDCTPSRQLSTTTLGAGEERHAERGVQLTTARASCQGNASSNMWHVWLLARGCYRAAERRQAGYTWPTMAASQKALPHPAGCALVLNSMAAAATHVHVLPWRPGNAVYGAAILYSPLLLANHAAVVLQC